MHQRCLHAIRQPAKCSHGRRERRRVTSTRLSGTDAFRLTFGRGAPPDASKSLKIAINRQKSLKIAKDR